MDFVDEYRDPAAARAIAQQIRDTTTRTWRLMEVCGGQTHNLIKFGIDTLLPDEIELVHGPGCPVCVTPVALIDAAIDIAGRGVTMCSFGDMLRVPGSTGDLLGAKARGGDVRVVYSPMDAVDIARREPDQEVVFFAVGFETTAPANAMAIHAAHREGLENISFIVSHVTVPPAMEAVLAGPERRVDGFLAAGHVCTIMGYRQYEDLAARHSVPIVVTGFEPLDLLEGIRMCITQLEDGRADVENQYARSVRRDGNPRAMELLDEVFEAVDRDWRGIGPIPQSGLGLRPTYQRFDALLRYPRDAAPAKESPDCIAGEVLQGIRRPSDCPAFGTRCTPEAPLGAPMVSNEGACAAYYLHRREVLP